MGFAQFSAFGLRWFLHGRRGAAGRAARVREGPRLRQGYGGQAVSGVAAARRGHESCAADRPARPRPQRAKRAVLVLVLVFRDPRTRTRTRTSGRSPGSNRPPLSSHESHPQGPATTGNRAPAPRARATRADDPPTRFALRRGRRERATSTSRTRTVPRWSVAFPGRESPWLRKGCVPLARPALAPSSAVVVDRLVAFRSTTTPTTTDHDGLRPSPFSVSASSSGVLPRPRPEYAAHGVTGRASRDARRPTPASPPSGIHPRITPRTTCGLSHFGNAIRRSTPHFTQTVGRELGNVLRAARPAAAQICRAINRVNTWRKRVAARRRKRAPG